MRYGKAVKAIFDHFQVILEMKKTDKFSNQKASLQFELLPSETFIIYTTIFMTIFLKIEMLRCSPLKRLFIYTLLSERFVKRESINMIIIS